VLSFLLFLGFITGAIESAVKGISPVLGIRALGLHGFEGGLA
jgi:hypothetical protein